MKDTYIRIRLSSEQKEMWQKEARRRGKTMTEFIVEAVDKAIGSVITKSNVITKSDVITKKSPVSDGEFRTYLNKEEVKK